MAYKEGWTVLEVVKSSSRPGVEYQIRKGADGKVYCSCPAWRFSEGHVCKHLKAYKAKGGTAEIARPEDVFLIARRRVTIAPIQPESIETKRRQTGRKSQK